MKFMKKISITCIAIQVLIDEIRPKIRGLAMPFTATIPNDTGSMGFMALEMRKGRTHGGGAVSRGLVAASLSHFGAGA